MLKSKPLELQQLKLRRCVRSSAGGWKLRLKGGSEKLSGRWYTSQIILGGVTIIIKYLKQHRTSENHLKADQARILDPRIDHFT